MSKTNLFSLENFRTTKKKLAKKNPVLDLSINFEYPEIHLLTQYKYKKRLKIVEKIIQENRLETSRLVQKLKGKLSKEKTDPFSIKAQLHYLDLKKIAALGFVGAIWINGIEGVDKKKVKWGKQFYTIVAKIKIEIEGKRKKNVELRFSMVKAKSMKKAVKKAKANYKTYGAPYLNVKGRIVRWKLVKIFDIYETNIHKSADFDRTESIELYSKFVKSSQTIAFLENKELCPIE